jgi:hypothetical protein
MYQVSPSAIHMPVDERCRGEALASISYVAHLTVTTMTQGAIHGWRAVYEDGGLVRAVSRRQRVCCILSWELLHGCMHLQCQLSHAGPLKCRWLAGRDGVAVDEQMSELHACLPAPTLVWPTWMHPPTLTLVTLLRCRCAGCLRAQTNCRQQGHPHLGRGPILECAAAAKGARSCVWVFHLLSKLKSNPFAAAAAAAAACCLAAWLHS